MPASTPSGTRPVVLALAGHDPTGGAGIQADIETLASLGCHAASVVTALTVQDTCDVKGFQPVDAELVMEQARAVLEDLPVVAIKIGMVGSAAVAAAIHSVLGDYPHLPVVLDPVLAAGGGGDLSGNELIEALTTLLLPRTTLITPNSPEARRLAPEGDTLDACAQQLLETGCRYVLITGTHEGEPQIAHRLYGQGRLLQVFRCKRLPHHYHGSGCTLASAIAGRLARGDDMETAVAIGQAYTWQSLNNGFRIGMGQHLPGRFFWTGRWGDGQP